MNVLTVAGQIPASGKCDPGQNQCLTITITCDKETVEAQRLVFCKETTTVKAY